MLRKLLPSLLLLCIGHTLFAQNYQCVQPGKKRYFINDKFYLRGIRIDSVKTIGGLQYLYPFKSPRGKYYEEPLQPGGSWLGDVIMITPDGTHLFINHAKDTVVIKPQAAVNDSWVLYDDTASIHYIATVTQADTMTVLNTLDSIKAITITALDGSTPLTTDPLHNKHIILSKTHGFVQVMDLYNLPFHGGASWLDSSDYFTAKVRKTSMFNLVDFHNPTFNDLYDYNVGDVMQRKTDYLNTATATTTITEATITKKETIAPGYTRYTLQQWHQVHTLYTNNYTTRASIETLAADTQTLMPDSLMPEEVGQKDFIYYNPNDTSFCTKSARYTFIGNNITEDGVSTFEPPDHVRKYKISIGWLEEIKANLSYSSTDKLIYVNRSGTPCGYKETLGVPNVDKATLSIYPNPANDVLHVEATATGTLYLINTFGQTVHTATLGKGTTTIPTATLPAGNYVLKLESAGATMHYRMVSVVH